MLGRIQQQIQQATTAWAEGTPTIPSPHIFPHRSHKSVGSSCGSSGRDDAPSGPNACVAAAGRYTSLTHLEGPAAPAVQVTDPVTDPTGSAVRATTAATTSGAGEAGADPEKDPAGSGSGWGNRTGAVSVAASVGSRTEEPAAATSNQ